MGKGAAGRANKHFRHGFFTGWKEYRYGSKPDISLAGKQSPWSAEKRQHVVDRAMDIMRDWRSSPFEHEGHVRHGIRSGLCETGFGWDRADDHAADVVRMCLTMMGAERPSWEQGQREHVAGQENCVRCGQALDDMQVARRERFCTVTCAATARMLRAQGENFQADSVGFSAYSIIRKAKHDLRPCSYCDEEFRPFRDDGSQKFCSLRCAGRAARNPDPTCRAPGCKRTFRFEQHKVYCSKTCRIRCEQIEGIHPRACAHCGTSFLAKKVHAIYCSDACGETAARIRKAERRGGLYLARGDVTACECNFCHQIFEASSARARYCSTGCKTMANGMRNGSWVPKVISAPLLDHVLHLARAA